MSQGRLSGCRYCGLFEKCVDGAGEILKQNFPGRAKADNIKVNPLFYGKVN